MNNKYSIIVLSCKKFSDMWVNNIVLFDKYWSDRPDLFLITDFDDVSIKNSNPSVKRSLRMIDSSMSGRLLESINKIAKTDYIFLTLDDYYVSKKVDCESINELIEIMSKNSIDYCRLFKEKKVPGSFLGEKTKYKKLPLVSTYEVNFYPSIWKTSALKSVIKQDEDIWKTEVRLTKRFRENKLNGIAVYNNNIFPFVDVVRKGKYLPKGISFIKRNGLYLSSRPVISKRETTELFFKNLFSNSKIIPNNIKSKLKNHYKKMGGTIYSEYENTED